MSAYGLNSRRRYGRQGDFLGIGSALSKIGGFIPGIGGTIAKVGGVIAGLGKPKASSPVLIAPKSNGGFTLPGGAKVSVDSVKVTGSGAYLGPLGAGIGSTSATLYTSSGRPRKKIRRINCTNPKALKRAMNRLGKFGDFARAMGYSRPPAKLRGFRGLPKRKRRTSCR